MKRSFAPIVLALVLASGLSACRKKFGPLRQEAQKAFDEKNYNEAIGDLNEALSRWADSDGRAVKGDAYQMLGKSYHAIGRNEQAMDAYRQAIGLSTSTYDSAYDLALIELASNQFEQAAAHFRDALRMKRDDPLATLGLANSYYGMKNFTAAQEMYERVVTVSPGVQDALDALKSLKTPGRPRHGAPKAKPAPPAKKSKSISKKKKTAKRRHG